MCYMNCPLECHFTGECNGYTTEQKIALGGYCVTPMPEPINIAITKIIDPTYDRVLKVRGNHLIDQKGERWDTVDHLFTYNLYDAEDHPIHIYLPYEETEEADHEQ